MKRFDAKALYDALDTQRRSRDLSWREVAAEIGVSVATISRLQSGMLAMVGWLGCGAAGDRPQLAYNSDVSGG